MHNTVARGLAMAAMAAATLAVPSPADTAAAAAMPAEHLMARLATMQDPSFVYTRDLLLARGESVVATLQAERQSDDWRRRLAAEAILLRLRRPQEVAQWDEALAGHLRSPMSYQAVLDTPKQVTFKPTRGAAPSVTLDSQAVAVLVEHLWLSIRESGSGSGTEVAAGRIVDLLGHLGDARAVDPVLVAARRDFRLRQACHQALVAIGRPVVPALLNALDSAADVQLIYGVLGELGDLAAAETLMTLLVTSPGHRRASLAAKALGELGVVQAAEPAAARLAQFLTSTGLSDWRDKEVFWDLREALIAMSPASSAAIARQRQGMEDVRWHFLLAGMEMELADAERLAAYRQQYPADLRGERHAPSPPAVPQGELREMGLGRLMVMAAFQHRGPAMVAVGREEAPGALEFLITAPAIAIAESIEGLALLGDERAIAHLSQMLEWDFALGRDPTHRARHWAGYRTRWRQAAQAVFRIGGPEALAALRQASEPPDEPRYESGRPLYALASALALGLEGNRDELAAMLDSPQPYLRHAAAEALARLGDERATAVMLKQAAASEGQEYLRLRELLLSLGERALPAVREACDSGDSLALQVTAEAIDLQIRMPDVCGEFDKRLSAAWHSISGMKVIHDDMVFRAGKAAADDQPCQLAPYVESLVMFRLSPRDVAAAVLGEFARERGIAVLVQAVRRGLSPQLAAMVLHEFGEEGLTAARNLPPPDPDRAAYSERSARSRAGTLALAIAEDPVGIEQILEALTSTWRVAGEADDSPLAQQRQQAWRRRANAMIRAANRFHDARLFDAMLTYALSNEVDLPTTHLIEAMTRYDDERLVAVLKSTVLAAGEHTTLRTITLRALAARDDVDTMDFLLESLDPGQPEQVRESALATMHLLLRYHLPKGREHWADAAARRWEQLLDDPSGAIQQRAAFALAERNIQAAAPRTSEWLSPDHPPRRGEVYEYLGRWGDETVGPKLFRIFREHRRSSVAAALGEMGYAAAAGDLAQALRHPPRFEPSAPVARALLQLGPEGLTLAGEVLRDTTRPWIFNALMQAFQAKGQAAAGQWDIIARKVAEFSGGQNLTVDLSGVWPHQRRGIEESAVRTMAAVDPDRSVPMLERLAVEHEDPRIRATAIELLRGGGAHRRAPAGAR